MTDAQPLKIMTYLDKRVRYHVSHAPALILYGLANGQEKMLFDLLGSEPLGDGDQVLDGKESDRVLII